MFYQLSNSVGSGKTQAILEHVRDNLGIGYLYVCPTVALCEAVYARLLAVLVDHHEYAGNGPIRLVVGEVRGNDPVFPRALEACRDYDTRLPPIVIVTTATFEYLLRELTNFEKSKFHVFIDEGLPAVRQEIFSPGNLQPYLELLEQDEAGYVVPTAGHAEVLEWVAHAPNRLAARQLDHLNTPQFKGIAELAVTPNYDLHMTVANGSIQSLGFLSPVPMLPFQSVTLIVAIFEQTLLPMIWRQRHGIEFEAFPLRRPLFDSHGAKGKFISIWHVLHEGDLPSKRNLGRDFETREPNAKDPRKSVIFFAGQQVDKYFQEAAEGTYCWAANKDFHNPDNVLTGRRMPAISAGLDEFKLFNNIVSFVCINPQPWVKRKMLELFQLDSDELYELWRFSYTYQTVGRCSLRMREREEPIEVVVTSKRCAEQLSALFPGSTIKGQITNLPRLSGSRGDNEPVLQFGLSYTKADNSAYSKYRSRCKKNGQEPLPKIEWFGKHRLQYLR